jgi:hypothetical protein
MKKFGLFLVVCLAGLSILFVLFACKPVVSRLPDSIKHLALNNGLDYAKDVVWDVENFPALADQGLYWTKLSNNNQGFEQAMLDEIVRDNSYTDYFNPEKPTVIYVHGVQQNGGNVRQVNLTTSDVFTNVDDFKHVLNENMTEIYKPTLWLEMDWNFGIYHWNKLSDPGLASLMPIEAAIWGTNYTRETISNSQLLGVQYRAPNNNYVRNVSEYSIAEQFAADYLRHVNAFNNFFDKEVGTAEVRVAAHSMGAMLSSATMFLLAELVHLGQLPAVALPGRYAMIDPYLGMSLPVGGSPATKFPDVIVNWTDGGKLLDDGDVGRTVTEMLKHLANLGVAIEFYLAKGWIPPTLEAHDEGIKQAATVYVYIDFDGMTKNFPRYGTMDSHNAICHWYFASIAFNYKLVGDGDGGYAPTASMPTSVLKENNGRIYLGATEWFLPEFVNFTRG